AHDGTLFLDEIGDLPLDLQPKILRAIQEGEVQPVGSTQCVQVDVRVVAATHRDLAAEETRGTFRRDLYARLALWELRVPPLRQRRVDLLDGIDHLVRRRGAAPLAFDVDAAEALLLHEWPLNLREVERLVNELAATATTGVLTPAHLPSWLGARE